MTAAEARKLLERVDRNYRAWRTRKDCRFVFGPLKDAIANLDRKGASAADRSLAATGYAFLGDVSDFIGAPRAAIKAYRAALRLDPKDSWSWCELASVLDDLGSYRAALRAVARAERLGAGSWRVGFLRDAARDGGEPRYKNGRDGQHPSPSWHVHELLARNRPRAALKLLDGRRHPYLRQLRARAYGALGDRNRMLKEWEALRETRGGFEIEVADWFFDPGGMWDMPRFWRALWAIRDRSLPGYGPAHLSMWEFLPEPKKAKWRSRAALRRHLRRHTLMLRYHLARTERDAAAARRLARRYPQWPEAIALARKLT